MPSRRSIPKPAVSSVIFGARSLEQLDDNLKTVDVKLAPEEVQKLILDVTISDLMINGTTGVYADRNGVVEQIPLSCALTTETLLAATQQIARKLGQNLSDQNPILNTRLPDGSRGER